MKISVLIATHKPYRQPADSIYTPVHAGKKGKTSIGFIGDDTGDNISGKNPNYCELTVLYWGWKNVNVDFLGLVHYRRHFIYREYIACYLFGKWKSILTSNHLKKLLCRSPIILPNKRCYYIETNESHYKHAHVCEPLDKTRQIISELYPEYLGFFEGVMNRTWAHMFNMLIMRKDILNDYCSWLFSILFELEKRIDISGYSVYESRVFGYISELLLDVWLDKNRYQGLECNVMFMENQHWPTKIYYFLVRKLKSDLLKEISN